MHVYALSCAEDKEVKDAIKIMRHALEQSMRCGRWGIRPSYSSLEESRELALSLLSLLQTCKLPRELYIYIYIYSYICEEKKEKKMYLRASDAFGRRFARPCEPLVDSSYGQECLCPR